MAALELLPPLLLLLLQLGAADVATLDGRAQLADQHDGIGLAEGRRSGGITGGGDERRTGLLNLVGVVSVLDRVDMLAGETLERRLLCLGQGSRCAQDGTVDRRLGEGGPANTGGEKGSEQGSQGHV
ncbi:MAG: hypothetical protein ACK56F_03595, partial [bacterium]